MNKTIKTLTQILLNRLYIWRSESSLNKTAHDKIKKLKDVGRFNTYPFKSFPPVISNYPFYRKSDIHWLNIYYSVFEKPDQNFIPLPAYTNFIEPVLNNYSLSRAIKEKNFYDKFLTGISTPPTLLRRIHGNYFDAEYKHVELNNMMLNKILNGLPGIILKPSIVSGSGKFIRKFIISENGYFSGDDKLCVEFLNNYKSDFVLQEVIIQYDFFRQFNPDSNNTIRVLTYRSLKNEEIHLLHILFRIGKKGLFLDHDNLGGVVIAINDFGKLNEFAMDAYGRKHYQYNNIIFKELREVPYLVKIRETSVRIAEKIHYARLLALDFTIDSKGDVLLLEINCKGNGISQYQYNNGSLFKEFTREILDQCKSFKPKFHFIQT